ncbi:hypothetical protein AS156_06900 [Bradyrhizobium macuxiense]|uniref:Uncharacterized protein n=1 Tax=Bradyrhizobium macuxiense TaxID=1755647 RepID=A0A109JTM1_9BRAD|nr:hypothetical protein AS156_06900 [Bradyrhizobium macuxiense]
MKEGARIAWLVLDNRLRDRAGFRNVAATFQGMRQRELDLLFARRERSCALEANDRLVKAAEHFVGDTEVSSKTGVIRIAGRRLCQQVERQINSLPRER